MDSKPVTVNPLHKNDDVLGRPLKVVQCEAREHGDNEGCVCKLIGSSVILTKQYDSPFCGTASFHIRGRKQRVRLSEVGLPNRFN
jgi:hypothetical protein